jgi:hypothetical protein
VTPEGFARAFPRLFHVAAASQVERIRRDGLRSAAALCEASGMPEPERDALLRRNRPTWTPIAPGPPDAGPPAWLRWQGMNDAPLRARLDPAIAVEEWRAFINGLVFLFPTEAAARRLRDSSDRGKGAKPPQAVLAFDTGAILAAGCGLRLCAYNNGFLDRSAAGPGRRLRHRADYCVLDQWPDGRLPAEIAIERGLPTGNAFGVLA